MLAPPGGMRIFIQVLINTGAANITTSFLWFALTFWAYLETRSVLATGVIGGAYMLLIALFGMLFGTVVDRHRKHRVMVISGLRDARRVPRRRGAVPRLPRVDPRRSQPALVLALLRHHPAGCGRREPPQHRPVDDGDPARARRAARQRERSRRHRPGRRVHGDERLQRSRDRPPRDGLDAPDRARAHRRRARAPPVHPHPRARARGATEKRPLIDLRGSVRAVARRRRACSP